MNLQYVDQPVKPISQLKSYPVKQSVCVTVSQSVYQSYCQLVSNWASQPVNWSVSW